MQTDQARIFSEFEGDRWFERNREALDRFDPRRDSPLRLMELYQLRPATVLELGASNGFRLAAIAERYGAKTVALEPSSQAVRQGRSRFPGVEFVEATADAIPLSQPFDLVIVNFVFHWIDRFRLLRAVAEIDRLLVDGGFLIVGDFFPNNRTRVRYHHLPDREAYTFKQDYAAVFLASGLYQQVSLLAGDHASNDLRADVAEEERIATWLLRKRLQEHYVEPALARR